MRSVFSKNAKRYFIIGQLLLLTVLVSIFLPRSGFTFDGVKQIELAVKNPGQSGPNHSALWVTNLGVNNTKLTVGTKPLDSAAAQERLYATEVIAGGKTVRLDDSLPASFRGSDTLFIRGHEEVATLMAPVDFPVNSSEFYSATLRKADGSSQVAPSWVSELGAIGKTGNNVFNADGIGYAPAVKGQTEVDKHYVFGVGVALSKPNSSVEFKLISRAEQTIKSLVLSSSTRVYWQAPLGEFIGGTDDFPSRIEMKVLTGTAQGFLSIKDVESGEFTPLPIAPYAGEGSLRNQAGDGGAIAREESNLSGESRSGGPMLDEESNLPVQSCSRGYAYFSNGVYNSRGTYYTYNVYGAPPNMCGTLLLRRFSPGNTTGNEETGPGWICTDAYGSAIRPSPQGWLTSVDQTADSIRIQWDCGSTTVGGDYKVDDVTDPDLQINQSGGYGVPIPTAFNGSASDRPWGTGFNFGYGGWSFLKPTFQDVSTGKYYDGQGYNSYSLVDNFPGTVTPSAGFSINWAVTPPPLSAHNSYDTYQWCMHSNDMFYFTPTRCVLFQGPR